MESEEKLKIKKRVNKKTELSKTHNSVVRLKKSFWFHLSTYMPYTCQPVRFQLCKAVGKTKQNSIFVFGVVCLFVFGEISTKNVSLQYLDEYKKAFIFNTEIRLHWNPAITKTIYTQFDSIVKQVSMEWIFS